MDVKDRDMRRKGKWIINKERTAVCCPFCKTKVRNCADEIKLLGTAFSGLNFCQYCGADMRGKYI